MNSSKLYKSLAVLRRPMANCFLVSIWIVEVWLEHFPMILIVTPSLSSSVAHRGRQQERLSAHTLTILASFGGLEGMFQQGMPRKVPWRVAITRVTPLFSHVLEHQSQPPTQYRCIFSKNYCEFVLYKSLRPVNIELSCCESKETQRRHEELIQNHCSSKR